MRSWQGWLVLGVVAAVGTLGCGASEPPSTGAGTGGASSSTGSGGSITVLPDGGSGGSGSGGAPGSGGEPADAVSPTDSAPDGGGSGGSSAADPGTEGDGDFTIAAPFMADPEMTNKPGVMRGQLVQWTMATSKTFADGTRKVAVYIPAGYKSGTETPFMVAQDGVNPQNGGSFGLDDLQPLLNNMIAEGKVPSMVGIFVDPASQRSVEYDTPSDKYYQFVETELIPEVLMRVKAMANIDLNLTKDPEGRGAFGGSSGGSCAFTMGWFHPESYRRILTLSGSFTPLKRTPPDFPNGAADYYMKAIPMTMPNKPLRVFLEAGSMDLGGWKAANDAMAKALAAAKYHYRYVAATGATHEDVRARRQYLPAAMEWLWRGYKKP
ncbi:MAG TPA: alpha/beta hydrolase-fold protein [Polyangia bacterium]|nr:alpha/beta hydrolase-fold protein [Polyangia bacterium]